MRSPAPKTGSPAPFICYTRPVDRPTLRDASPTAARARRADVRNPILALPAAARLSTLSPMARVELRMLLLDLRRDAQKRAEECWRRHKAPMAAYWKAVAVYAGHIARVLR